jgi:aerobic carbon-monoxide dehydrogenase medium subunit
MYPAPFEYHRATSVQDAIMLLEQYGEDGKLLAGGHSLLPVMKLRFASPSHLIDIARIPGLSGIAERDGMICIGAATVHADVAASPLIRSRLALLVKAASLIGDVQVRNRGTIGGSLAHADPGADYPAVLLATGAQIVAAGKKGERVIASENFFLDTLATALETGEIITEVRIPLIGQASGGAYEQLSDPASGYAVVGVAAVVSMASGKVTAARLGMTGLAQKAVRLAAAERAIVGQPASETSTRAAAANAADGLSFYDDQRGSAAYKAHLAQVYTQRALDRAIALAKDS